MSKTDHARKPRNIAKRKTKDDVALDTYLRGEKPRSARVRYPSVTEHIAESMALPRPITNLPGLQAGMHASPWRKIDRLGIDSYTFFRKTGHLQTIADYKNALVEDQAGGPEDRLAEWEAILLDLPENTWWMTESTRVQPGGYKAVDVEPYEHDYELGGCCRDHDYTFEDEVDDYPESTFLPVLTLYETFHHLGDDGWSVTGPGKEEPMLKSTHYVRVYEVAREVGIATRDLINHLCRNGEYVRSSSSMIAQPVADRVRAAAGVLVEEYGGRPVSQESPGMSALDDLRRRLSETDAPRPTTGWGPRPGAPRPGNQPLPRNPFLVGVR